MNKISKVLIVLVLGLELGVSHVEAMTTVSQLNITGGSIGLTLNGSTTPIGGTFSTTGSIVMGSYQPPPDIVRPFSVGPFNFELASHPGTDSSSPLPPPSAVVNGSTITADLQSLVMKISGSGAPGGSAFLSVGNQAPAMAEGTYDANTGAFEISWLHLYGSEVPWMAGLQIGLNGTDNVVATTPLPAAAWLFGTGLMSLPLVRRVIRG